MLNEFFIAAGVDGIISGQVVDLDSEKKKISKDFLLSVAERIYDIASSNNIKFIRWSSNLRNPAEKY